MATDTKGIHNNADEKGNFNRQVSSFRNAIQPGGQFAPEKGRYHLYVALGCPWAHRSLIVRQLKGLEDFIDVSVVHPHLHEGGWHFTTPEAAANPAPVSQHSDDSFPGATQDHLFGFSHLSKIYYKANPDYNARFTVPVVWDKVEGTIVNNESSEVIRFLNSAFNELLPEGKNKDLDLYPEELRKEIDELNEWVYHDINNGVYKTGFATTQEAYEKAVIPLSKALERVNERLSDGREFLVGGRLTEADIRLYTTVVRYDPVYHNHFKCNIGSIRHDYPHVNRWLKNLYWNYPAFKNTTNFDHIKELYWYSQVNLNPTRIVPLGPKHDVEPL
ncbi:glutathione S-transferase [Cryptococcus gattii Ru294]|nr:glutathione S-transferase [Cryptococcus gattii Ru294]